jgi:hypothetical protein
MASRGTEFFANDKGIHPDSEIINTEELKKSAS